jgi:hypothetical protein
VPTVPGPYDSKRMCSLPALRIQGVLMPKTRTKIWPLRRKRRCMHTSKTHLGGGYYVCHQCKKPINEGDLQYIAKRYRQIRPKDEEMRNNAQGDDNE